MFYTPFILLIVEDLNPMVPLLIITIMPPNIMHNECVKMYIYRVAQK